MNLSKLDDMYMKYLSRAGKTLFITKLFQIEGKISKKKLQSLKIQRANKVTSNTQIEIFKSFKMWGGASCKNVLGLNVNTVRLP